MKLIVGLGNPGRTYAPTRHNAGAQCVHHLARRYAVPLERRTPYALLGQGSIQGQPVLLAQPRTAMNESGPAVARLVRRFQVPLSHLLVVYDDMDLPLGRLRLRPRGSAGGHRGMASVITALGTQEVPRLRIGIGRPPPGVDEVTYVLGAFTPPEEEVMQEVRQRAAAAILCFLTEGLEAAMNRFNQGGPGVSTGGGPQGA